MDKLFMVILVVFGLAGLFFFVLANFSQTDSHENAHVQINKYFGVDSNKVVTFFGSNYVVPIQDFNSKEDKDKAYFLHGVNEVVGYNLVPLFNGVYAILIVGFLFLGVVIWMK